MHPLENLYDTITYTWSPAKRFKLFSGESPRSLRLHLETSSCKLSCSKQFFNLTQILFDALRLYELRKLELANHELTS